MFGFNWRCVHVYFANIPKYNYFIKRNNLTSLPPTDPKKVVL